MAEIKPNRFSLSSVELGSEFFSRKDYEKTRKILVNIIKEGGFKAYGHSSDYWDFDELKHRLTENVYVYTNFEHPIAAHISEETVDDKENAYLTLKLTSNREIPDEFVEKIMSCAKLSSIK